MENGSFGGIKRRKKMFIGLVDEVATKKIKKRKAGLQSRDPTTKKQCTMQLLVEETLSEDSQSSSSENQSEVSIESQSSEDSRSIMQYKGSIGEK